MHPLMYGVIGLVLYSILNAFLQRATAHVSAQVVVAIYSSVMATCAWATVFFTNQTMAVRGMSHKEISLALFLGVLSFAADLSWFKAFQLKANPVVLFAIISMAAFLATMIFGAINRTAPHWKEVLGVLICCYGAYIANTARV